MRREITLNLDTFFIRIFPCNKSVDWNVNTDIQVTRDWIGEMESYGCGVDGRRVVKDSLDWLEIEFGEVHTGKKIPNNEFLELLTVVMKDIKIRGKDGFCVYRGSILYRIPYPIVNLHTDMVTANTLTGFSGTLSSNQPSIRCDVPCPVFDQWIRDYMRSISLSVYVNRLKFHTINSPIVSREKSDPLYLHDLSISFLLSCGERGGEANGVSRESGD